ncbi:Polyamine transporter rmv1 [Thalictrum thalictroides]|uniref:Polyamine transporter rmv1 n=1 Tax=Thalictrum thalictroides TaxID=46969 RepID=A0A7J6XAQ4_THATH|nr:Polyamine transporter rmv1 [Thalictrum thalictroides]
MGSSRFLSGVINNVAYPVLCVYYLKIVFPVFAKGLARYLGITGSTLVLAFLNYIGLTIVGYTVVALGVVSLIPFILMACTISIPKIHPRRWLDHAGEVDKPQRTLPKALFSAGILSCLGYLIPFIAIVGSLNVDQNKWDDGLLADAAGMIGGKWLKFWVEIGVVLSAIGLFEAQLSSCSFQLLGMAELGILPRRFALRSSRFDTPWVGILVSSLITLGVSYLDFTIIISSANFLYSLGMLLEFASFIWLRNKYPKLKRPYKVPGGIPVLICICLVPTAFIIFMMVIATTI